MFHLPAPRVICFGTDATAYAGSRKNLAKNLARLRAARISGVQPAYYSSERRRIVYANTAGALYSFEKNARETVVVR
jgi:hypothetical protein